MDNKRLESLIKKSEGIKLDFKKELNLEYDSGKKEFVKDVSAIANSKGGRGYIIYGVEDKTKKITGVDLLEFEEERLQQIISNRVEPPIPVRVEVCNIEEKNVIVLTIFNSDQKPHQLKGSGRFYIRRGSTTDYARRHEIANLMQEYGLVDFETTMMKNLREKALDNKLISIYMKRSFVQLGNDEKYLLSALGILKQDISTGHFHPTVGGMLLFGRNPQVFLPHTGIKIKFEDDIYHIRGTILSMINKASRKIAEIIDDRSYPIRAVEQAIANALVHRDYWDKERGVEVEILETSIEITNPGARIELSSEDEFLLRRRNSWLYERMLVIDKRGRFLKHGKGIKKIKQMFEYSDKVKFINEENQNVFKVILPR